MQYLEGGIFVFHSALDLGVLSLAGAGMGVDSGLPDFRGSTGLFKDKELAMSYEERHLLFSMGMLEIFEDNSGDAITLTVVGGGYLCRR